MKPAESSKSNLIAPPVHRLARPTIRSRMSVLHRRKARQAVMFGLTGASLVLTIGFLALLLGFVARRALPVMSWEFILPMPRRGG